MPSGSNHDVDIEEDAETYSSDDGVASDGGEDNKAPAMNGIQSNPSKHLGDSSAGSDPEILLAFYRHLFPWRLLFQWLNHSQKPSVDFTQREFAFTLPNDVYLRYQSFLNFETLKKEVLKLNPSRFEIGPVYSANPRDRKTLKKSAFRPIEKELVFDIDLTDYDDIRTCCSKASICEKCWQFIVMAIKVLDAALRDDFNFQHILWVYSGRRGVHAWVCDKKARRMDDSKRRAVAAYLEVLKGGAQAGKKVNLKRPLHPHISRSFDLLKDTFLEDILESQDPWGLSERSERLLRLLPDMALNDALRMKWESQHNRPSKNKWTDIDEMAKTGVSNSLQPKSLVEAKQDILLEYAYPRLDAEVSKHLNHLLKSPFCVHPGTGRVCVPIDPDNINTFDPQKVPTVKELLDELNRSSSEVGSSEFKTSGLEYQRTGLKSYIEFFNSFVRHLLSEESKAKDIVNSNSLEY